MIVPWNQSEFIELYPQFADKYTSAFLSLMWEQVCAIVDNTDNSRIPYNTDEGVVVRKIVLYAIMCHFLTMQEWTTNGQPGALTSASEGSVSTGFNIPSYGSGGSVFADWLNQTNCGRTAWMLMRKYFLGGQYYGMKVCHPFG